MKAIKKIDVSEEIKLLESNFSRDFNSQKLQIELNIFPTIFKQSSPGDFNPQKLQSELNILKLPSNNQHQEILIHKIYKASSISFQPLSSNQHQEILIHKIYKASSISFQPPSSNQHQEILIHKNKDQNMASINYCSKNI